MRQKSINQMTLEGQWAEYCVIEHHDGREFAKFFGGAQVVREEIDESEYVTTDPGKVGECVCYNLRFSRIVGESSSSWIVFPHLHGEVRFREGERMSDNFDRMPYGIIDKQVTGIGATTLELNSPRNSIIVVPTKSLANNKAAKFPSSHYIGSAIAGKQPRFSISAVRKYLQDSTIAYKKFIVVADSLPKLLEVIGEEHYDDFFLMIDEIDMMQADSTFRPALEKLIDYYFLFNYKNRALVSATIKDFSHPDLQKEPRITIRFIEPPRLHINAVVATNNPNAVLKQKIEMLQKAHPDQKIVVAYNSITLILGLIYWLPENLRAECAILCGENSKADAGEYYSELLSGDMLPKTINFITCAYFAGVDFHDRFHLITVSNSHKPYTMVSVEQIIQIAGRCRLLGGLLSHVVIHNCDSQPLTEIGAYQHMLNYKADAIISLYEAMDRLSVDAELQGLFSILKSTIGAKGTEKLPGETPICLTRVDAFGRYGKAYFNIDALLNRVVVRTQLYNQRRGLYLALSEQMHRVDLYEWLEIPFTTEQKVAETTARDVAQNNNDEELQRIIEEIQAEATIGAIDGTTLENITRNARRYGALFVTYFNKLRPYVNMETLITQLQECIRGNNSDKLRLTNYANAVIFRVLAEDHPFKVLIMQAFEVNQRYTPQQIYEKLRPIFQNQHLGNIQNPSIAVKYFLRFFSASRGRSDNLGAYYKIQRLYAEEINDEVPLAYIDSDQNVIDWFVRNY